MPRFPRTVRPSGWVWAAALLAAALSACAPQTAVIETVDGIEVTLRDERDPPRTAPGPDFSEQLALRAERSVARVVVIYQDIVVFNDSDPVQLFSAAQVKTIAGVLARELPKLPPDKRLGFICLDPHLNYEIDVEVFPEGNYLVYDFRSLMRRTGPTQRGAMQKNLGTLFPHRDQIAEGDRYPLLKDPFGSTAGPDLRPRESSDGDPLPESPL